jgi:hypothetical protein
MADYVEPIVRDIDTRLSELKEEVDRLEAAKAALLGSRRGPGRPRGASSTETPSSAPVTRHGSRRRGPGRPRGRRGGNTRSNQALELVRSQPGITIPQIAESLKIEPNYLYRVLPKLVADGLVKRDGQGWFPTDATGDSEATSAQ